MEHSPELSEEQRDLALRRFRIIQPYLENGVPLTEVGKYHNVAIRTLQHWVKRYRERGLTGLARKPRKDRGQRRMPKTLENLIEGLALKKPKPSVATVHRQITSLCKDNGWPAPSYASVYNVIRKLEPALTTLAHEGDKRYREVFDLIHRREAQRPNEIWQADHTLLDIWIQHQNEPIRPWLTVIQDDYSRAVAGYFLNVNAPSAMQTALALHQAIWRKEDPRWPVCGIPDTFYTDHGSDFTSRHMEQIAADLKMKLQFSIPGAPRGRGRIERFFQTVNQLFLSQLPGYIHAPEVPLKHMLTLPVLDSLFREFLLDQYFVQAHSATGIPPLERWTQGAFLPRLPDSREQLDILLLQVAKTRRVHPDGIRFQGLRYIDITLAAYVGEDVVIRYDPRDMAEIRVYLNDQFLCRAVCPELTQTQIGLKDIIQARNRRRKELTSKLRDRSKLVDMYLGVHRAQELNSEVSEMRLSVPDTEKQAHKSTLKRYHNE